MTTLREAATQALEAMDKATRFMSDADYRKLNEAIDALKAALVEDAMQKFTDVNQELMAALGCDHCNHPLYAATRCRVCGRVTEPVQEPVAWVLALPDGRLDRLSVVAYDDEAEEMLQRSIAGCTLVPLYPAPPQRKPEPNSDYERGFVDGMSEQARRSVDKAVNAMIKCKPLAEEEIARLVTNDMVKFARAIERAHGIGGEE